MAVDRNTHWRDTAHPARFFFVDARAAFPFVLLLAHIRWWTFGVALATTIFFALLERYGFTVPVFLRWLRSFFAGPYKSASPWWKT